MYVIAFSNKNLPHQLKPCFLNFGGFLKGKDIHVSKLVRFCVAEGFVQANMENGPEGAAQGFLEDLISRNLVMDVEKRPNGKLKTCRIHDLLHKFCLEKAKHENFFRRINRFSGEDTFPEKSKEYRLFVHSFEDQIDLFKLVKVLDLESFNIGGTFPSEIQFLIHLRYIAAQTSESSISSSMAKLRNLETFVVRRLGVEVILPSSLLKIVKMRNIHVNHRASFSLHENNGESLANSQLDNLETFSSPLLSYGEDAKMIFRKMPKLRNLSCIFSGTFGYSEKVKGRCVLFPRLEFLSHLESLKLVSNSYPSQLPHVFSFSTTLRELTLSNFRLPWSQISTIGELPNLETLKLLLRAFEGDEWEVKYLEFPKLKYLELDDLNIVEWFVPDDAFPMLERLVLTKCKRFEKIPSPFEEALCLKSIEVNWCSWKFYQMQDILLSRGCSSQRIYGSPEYLAHGQLTEKADVYSFGVPLLEIVTGRQINRSKSTDSNSLISIVSSEPILIYFRIYTIAARNVLLTGVAVSVDETGITAFSTWESRGTV
ncbi:hypothetical protein RND71_023121 [Anisodus tanguticus]|uniref:Uncharacterized protein n=1 Tax=Anisodus tanguticus TaxID=243964 RepID=A0AAE1RTB5_9SOLA|nr:hypothetical protein RND71_023121 [Anisodus tanguticus]